MTRQLSTHYSTDNATALLKLSSLASSTRPVNGMMHLPDGWNLTREVTINHFGIQLVVATREKEAILAIGAHWPTFFNYFYLDERPALSRVKLAIAHQLDENVLAQDCFTASYFHNRETFITGLNAVIQHTDIDTLYIVGDLLTAPLAQLALLDISLNYPDSFTAINGYTFNTPHFGNQAFANLLNPGGTQQNVNCYAINLTGDSFNTPSTPQQNLDESLRVVASGQQKTASLHQQATNNFNDLAHRPSPWALRSAAGMTQSLTSGTIAFHNQHRLPDIPAFQPPTGFNLTIAVQLANIINACYQLRINSANSFSDDTFTILEQSGPDASFPYFALENNTMIAIVFLGSTHWDAFTQRVISRRYVNTREKRGVSEFLQAFTHGINNIPDKLLNKNKPVYIAGHSDGAAMASAVAWRFHEVIGDDSFTINGIYNFGSIPSLAINNQGQKENYQTAFPLAFDIVRPLDVMAQINNGYKTHWGKQVFLPGGVMAHENGSTFHAINGYQTILQAISDNQ